MIVPNKRDTRHKVWLYRLLIGLLDDSVINNQIFFKGGTCASMLGYLDRFSVDLDFDLSEKANKDKLRPVFRAVFKKAGVEVKDESRKALQFFLKYPSDPGLRNTIKLDVIDQESRASQYAPAYLAEIDRFAICQTTETMFGHKLVALTDRYRKTKTIAARDLYDIHHFFYQGYSYWGGIIEERTGKQVREYLVELKDFIDKKITQKVIDEDLNTLLKPKKFRKLRTVLKRETMVMLGDEIERVGKD